MSFAESGYWNDEFGETTNNEWKRDSSVIMSSVIPSLKYRCPVFARGVTEDTQHEKLGKEGITVPGMQLIAMKCQLLPKSPDPDAGISKWS
jgi:hypothetical protein